MRYRNCAPLTPSTTIWLVISGNAALACAIDKVSERVPVPPSLVAERDTALIPAWVGVPETRPVVALTPRPFGKPAAP